MARYHARSWADSKNRRVEVPPPWSSRSPRGREERGEALRKPGTQSLPCSVGEGLLGRLRMSGPSLGEGGGTLQAAGSAWAKVLR